MHYMIDLETLGTTRDCVILSIGAVMFDPHTGTKHQKFYAKSPVDSGLNLERTIDIRTVQWRMRQSKEARDEAFSGTLDLSEALNLFREFMFSDCDGGIVWSKGPNFDIEILKHAYKESPPWLYADIRCVRTMQELFPDISLPKVTAHNAVADALAQTDFVIECYKELRRLRSC